MSAPSAAGRSARRSASAGSRCRTSSATRRTAGASSSPAATRMSTSTPRPKPGRGARWAISRACGPSAADRRQRAPGRRPYRVPAPTAGAIPVANSRAAIRRQASKPSSAANSSSARLDPDQRAPLLGQTGVDHQIVGVPEILDRHQRRVAPSLAGGVAAHLDASPDPREQILGPVRVAESRLAQGREKPELENRADIGARPPERRQIEDAAVGVADHRDIGPTDHAIDGFAGPRRDFVVEGIQALDPVPGAQVLLDPADLDRLRQEDLRSSKIELGPSRHAVSPPRAVKLRHQSGGKRKDRRAERLSPAAVAEVASTPGRDTYFAQG